MDIDRGDLREIVKHGNWTAGRVMVAVEVVLLCLLIAGFIGGVVGGNIGGTLGGCNFSYGSEALGCIGGMFIGFFVGLVIGGLLSIKPVRLVREMPQDIALVVGTLVGLGEVGWCLLWPNG